MLYDKSNPIKVLNAKRRAIINSYGTDILLLYSSYYQFTDYYLSKGKIKEAELLSRQIIELYPDDDESYGLLPRILVKKGDLKNAIRYYELNDQKMANPLPCRVFNHICILAG